jgi:hypothetical protein
MIFRYTKDVKSFVLSILVIGVMGLSPSFAYGQAVDMGSLRVQIEQLMEQALAIRGHIKQMAFEQPFQAMSLASDVAGQRKKQVALQVGHWKVEEAPWELRNLDPHRQSKGAGYMEWEISLRIAQETKKILEEQGIAVTILPAILPSTYKADVFVAIHADQNPAAPWLSGFKVAPSAFDQSGKAKLLSDIMIQEYRAATWLNQETYIPSSMPYYYAFNHEKFIYAVHPTTPAVIIETGYLPNPRDRAILLSNPHMAAAGIANGVIKFFKEN